MSDLAVHLDGVGKDYKFFSLRDITLEIPYGHIMGFIGPNGAGKSTTMIVGGQIAVIVVALALTFYVQSRKRSFI